jgi:hypothetical protein
MLDARSQINSRFGDGRRTKMGTVKHHGWSTSEDEIPQPTSIVMGKNLRQSERSQEEPRQKEEGAASWMPTSKPPSRL